MPILKRRLEVLEVNEKSLINLSTLHPDLRAIFKEVIKHFNFTITKKIKEDDTALNAHPTNVCLHPKNQREKTFYIHAMSFFGIRVMEIADKLMREGKIKHKLFWGAGQGEDIYLDKYSFLDYARFELLTYG